MNILVRQIGFEKIELGKILGEITQRKINKCATVFENNPSKVYYAGQFICGNVHLTMNEKKKVSSVFVEIVGKSYVCWYEEKSERRSEFSGEEIFFRNRIELTPHQSEDKIQLIPGSYEYNFEYKLPDDLPSSLELKYGYVRYKVCVVLESLWSKEEFDNSLTIIGLSNLTPSMREPITAENYATFNHIPFICCCHQSDPLETVAHIPTDGYLPRQTIDLHLHVNNKSSQPVLEFTVQLLQKIQYLSDVKRTNKRNDKIILKQQYVQGCEAGQVKEIDVKILVPTVPPNLISLCNLIQIKYLIRISVSMPWFHCDPVLNLPINICSDPVQDDPTLPAWLNPLANDFY